MEITNKDIENLFELRKKDTFLNHLWYVLSGDYSPQGEIGRNEIKVWKQSFLNKTFYPIFIFELNAKNHLTNIRVKLNPIGKMFVGLYFIGIMAIVFTSLSNGFNVLESWLPTLIVAVFLVILTALFRKIYLFEKQSQLDEILEFLDVEVEEKQSEKEWSIKNILIRLFTYPFCLFLLGLNFFLIIPEGQYMLALGTFGFVGFYLTTDLMMIFRKDSAANKT